MIVKIAPLGERVVEVNVEVGTTTGTALDIANVDENGRDVRLNNSEANLDSPITNEGSVITLAQRMKGGI